ncbi:hypothetical protein G7069_06700 [Lysobacter sp. HDW10]|uniref:hypothetical protein n=1 Tax=Lysobacter sp. HDW10 TaxID=2714936 RepID=UPI00140A1DB2|nr:hypothetical protein [Lysobacter sp. HDW10]QIK81312.1 hypothetical protein G7069_06700 [Lysobacter sp. HDW10]
MSKDVMAQKNGRYDRPSFPDAQQLVFVAAALLVLVLSSTLLLLRRRWRVAPLRAGRVLRTCLRRFLLCITAHTHLVAIMQTLLLLIIGLIRILILVLVHAGLLQLPDSIRRMASVGDRALVMRDISLKHASCDSDSRR